MNVYLLIQLLNFYFLFFFSNKKSLGIIEKNYYQKLFIMEKCNKKIVI